MTWTYRLILGAMVVVLVGSTMVLMQPQPQPQVIASPPEVIAFRVIEPGAKGTTCSLLPRSPHERMRWICIAPDAVSDATMIEEIK